MQADGSDTMKEHSDNFIVDIEQCFTDRDFDEQTKDSLARNVTTKSVVLAPFNSTKTEQSEMHNSQKQHFFDKHLIMKLSKQVKEVDELYEKNNNCDLDNGVYNEFLESKSEKGPGSNKKGPPKQSPSPALEEDDEAIIYSTTKSTIKKKNNAPLRESL